MIKRSALSLFTARHYAGILGICLLCCIATGAAATAEPPAATTARSALESIATRMVTALQDATVREDERQLEQLVRTELVPHIDFRVSANLVLGPHWKDATEAQRNAFIEEFRAFLVRFYTSALASHVDSEAIPLDIMSFRDEPKVKDPRQVFVRSYVTQADGKEVAVEYRMFWRDAWKVIDVSVAGISMVQNYRSNFTSTVKQQGLDALIAQLRERNQSFAAN
ncbi:MAG: MlaC/ttg2D family ABC transporter substrate-binding protein [Gammaproteobacteria bacterium]|jgi:phospholipid transport system substrate-binding protein